MKKFDLKSFIAGILIATICISSAIFGTAAVKSVQATFAGLKKVVVNGTTSVPKQDKQPLVYNNNIYIPLSYLSDYLYKNATWDKKNGVVTISGIKVGKADQSAIFQAIDLNIKHSNDADIKGYMSDISSKMDSTTLQSTQAAIEYLFTNYQLNFKVTKKEIIAYDGNSCEVRMVMETRKISGEQEYSDNRSTTIQKMVKENGKWKLSYSYIEKAEALQ